jgi:hypothetical protein
MISGQMTKSQQLSFRLTGALMGLMFGAAVLGFGFMPFFLPNRQLDKGTQIAAVVAGPVIIALGFWLTRWMNADTVVEFACDGSSFRFRKLGSDCAETRDLSDVAKVPADRGRYGGVSYRVVFRDGTQADLCCGSLPNSKVFAEWLRSHIQSA